MDGMNSKLLSIEQATDFLLTNANSKSVSKETSDYHLSFEEMLSKVSEKSNELRFSKHANQRLESRNISLSNEQMDRLSEGVNKARTKQINESLVMMDNLAFIVNVKNNTVVTALEQNEESNVFTNIDGAVIV